MDKQTFLNLYLKAGGKYRLFNELQQELDSSLHLSAWSFIRRRSKWIDATEPSPKGEVKDTRPVAGGTITKPTERRLGLSGKRFVFTAAQNNTYVHTEFLASLLNFCEVNDAQLVVGKFTYNKNGFQNATKDDDDLWYDPQIKPYLIDGAAVLLDSPYSTIWCGELDILPTAASPLSGLESYTKQHPGIVPHAKVQMLSCPVLKDYPKKFMYTTGAVTLRNYIQRKAGQKAEFHHVFGALFVDITEHGEFRRQLIADENGVFFDLDTMYTPTTTKKERVLGITWGDIHAEHLSKDVYDGCFQNDGGSMLDKLNPHYQFIHDLTDFSARNHHNIHSGHFLATQHAKGQSSVSAGLETSASVLSKLLRPSTITVVVESNHDLAFRRWLDTADVRHDYVNAEFFHTCNAEVFKQIRHRNDFNVFAWALTRIKPELGECVFLREDDSFILYNDIECGMHGHRGSNGSRGSINSFRKLGRKCNVGHMHSAAIYDGVFVSGISCNSDLGYNKGPSSWSHSHIVVYANGKRAIITMEGSKWH